MSLTTKVKVAKFSFLNEKSYYKTVIVSISVDIRIYLPEKVIIHPGRFYLPLKVIFTSA